MTILSRCSSSTAPLFKQVNDTYGHATGDLVLRELGERARSVLRAGDTVGRFGGEEFLVLLPETGQQEAREVAERLRSAVAASSLASQAIEGGIAITVSIGVASASEVQEQADQAMYWAKCLGRNQVRTATEAARANRNAELKAATAAALERQEWVLVDGRGPESQVRVEQLGMIYSLMGVLDWREPGASEHAHETSDLVAGMARLLQFDEAPPRRSCTTSARSPCPTGCCNNPGSTSRHRNGTCCTSMPNWEPTSWRPAPGWPSWRRLFATVTSAGMGRVTPADSLGRPFLWRHD